jgi:NADPH-dependent 2,4-dienoyl-CoA reductase/sulfur reductase-like enzyme
MAEIVIVGAGPAGMAAALQLVVHGIAPVVIDESPRPGGQAYRQPPPALALDIEALLGSEAAKYRRLHARFAAIRDRIDYRPGTLVWGVSDGQVHMLADGSVATQPYDALVLASGATDRLLPVQGWTLPGVFTLGGAQTILKDQGCVIGRRVVLCGSSPLLYLAAVQYRAMGADIVGVLDTTPFAAKLAALPALMASPRTLARGVGYLAKLGAQGVPVHHGVRLLAFEGRDGVEALQYRDRRGKVWRLACDAVAVGFGLRPESQLAELAGCRLRYDERFRQWLPECDADGRCGSGVYTAGDGSAIGGADAAELSGTLAACAVLEDRGVALSSIDRAGLRRELVRLRRFQAGMAKAFAWPHQWMGELADEVPVCRCENVTAGEIRETLRAAFGPVEVNRAKAVSRCGMGRCQGRFCGLAVSELIATTLGRPHAEVGRLRAQAPVKPLAMSARIEG